MLVLFQGFLDSLVLKYTLIVCTYCVYFLYLDFYVFQMANFAINSLSTKLLQSDKDILGLPFCIATRELMLNYSKPHAIQSFAL